VGRIYAPQRAPRRSPQKIDVYVDDVLRWLAQGRQDRTLLASKMGVSDRKMRKAIEIARTRGALVITTPGPLHLYELAPSRAEYLRWRRHEVMSRMGTFGKQLRAMDNTADRRWPAEQQRLDLFANEATA
jgi:hypothetical protein